LRKRANKRDAKKENCTKIISFYRTIEPIYIKPLASRPPLVFLESSESFGEGRDMENETFEALKCATIEFLMLEEFFISLESTWNINV